MNLNLASLVDEPDAQPEVESVTADDFAGCLEAVVECNLVHEELMEERELFKEQMDAYLRLEDLIGTVERMGVTPELIDMVGDQLKEIAPSFCTEEKEKVLEELETVFEGIGASMVTAWKKFVAKMKDSLKREFQANSKIMRTLDQLLKEKKDFKGDMTPVLNSMVVGHDVDVVLGTLQKMAGIIKMPIIIPKFMKNVPDQYEAQESEQNKHAAKFKLDADKTCAIGYDGLRNLYVSKNLTKRYTQSIQSTGVKSLKDIIAMGKAAKESVCGEDLTSHYWAIQDELIKALNQFPVGEARAANRVYWMLSDAVVTAFNVSHRRTTDFALQAVATLNAVK